MVMSSDDKEFADIPYYLFGKLYPSPKGWEFWRASSEDLQLEALSEIRTKRLAGALPCLAPLFTMENYSVVAACADVVAYLLHGALHESLQLLSNGLHRLVAYETIAHARMANITPSLVERLRVPAETEWAVFGLLSFHGNGRVREAALVRLGLLESGLEIPFLLYRANDWVQPIANQARQLLSLRLQDRPVRQFSECLPIVFTLRSRLRGHLSEIQSEICSRISANEQVQFLEQLANAATSLYRRWLLALAVANSAERDEAGALSARLRSDADPIIRMAAWGAVWAGFPPLETLRQGLKDTWPAIRRRSLETLCQRGDPAMIEELQRALFDPAHSLRATARYFLEKQGETDVGRYYRDQLSALGTVSAAMVKGLSECGNANDASLLKPLLGHPRISIRRVVEQGIGRLDFEGSLHELKNALVDSSPGVSKTAYRVLEKHADMLGADYILGLIDEAHPLHVSRSAIGLMRSLSKWTAILTLLDALAAAPEFNDSLRIEIKRWLATFNRSWIQPTKTELARFATLTEERATFLPPPLLCEFRQIVQCQSNLRK